MSWRFLEQVSVGWPGSHNLIFVLQDSASISTLFQPILKMFLQVEARGEDQPCLQFLWGEESTSNVVVHQYTRHIFGACDSPTSANFTLQKTASDHRAE